MTIDEFKQYIIDNKIDDNMEIIIDISDKIDKEYDCIRRDKMESFNKDHIKIVDNELIVELFLYE
jgi:hypothetical protein